MIHDAKVEVTCDGEHCRESIEVQPDFTYPNYSGKGGSYDCSDSALAEKIREAGWTVEDDDKHYCESCREPNEKPTTRGRITSPFGGQKLIGHPH